ncbi:DENN domain-containing protein [Chloropicon primus]|uniref:DENN domain-containing protein n=2 Tax=Chloropicon primus TaxID=1764295 RepID=A0A5B8MU71_9CHLO|nr:DENN domain-containing protein [Chloropicon primus]UPR03328.1 DENN domain-containing protein [Chloropicon primus]|eukprot:QDZ24119.1 DENN domain-containing protein [Chloropicon primus]
MGLRVPEAEPRALVEDFLLLRARRHREEQPGSSSDQASWYGSQRLATYPSGGARSTPEVETISAKILDTLPKLYEYECSGTASGGERVFLPLAVTDELGQRWIAYSLLVPEESEEGEQIMILVGLSRLKRCFTGMCTLLETILETSRKAGGAAEAGKLMSWVAGLAPYPLPGLAYRVVVEPCGAEKAIAMGFGNCAPSNILPCTLPPQFYKLIQILGIHGLFKLWISALLEQRILLVTSKKGQLAASFLTVCAETLLMLLEPLKWQGIYVPFVPNTMSVLVEAPTPYIMGISESGFRNAELDDGIVEVNIDNGRICFPSNLPVVPESLESKLDMIDTTLGDPLQRGYSCGASGLVYSAEEIQYLLFQVRKCFGTILVDIVENTKKLSQNGARSLEDIRDLRNGRRFSGEPVGSATASSQASSKEHSPQQGNAVELTKGYSFSQTPDASSSKKKLFVHRRAVSWDFMRSPQVLNALQKGEEDEELKFDFIPATESYEDSLYFYEEFYQTQIYQEFLSSGWPANWPACMQWEEDEMNKRHSANKASLTFRLQLGKIEGEASCSCAEAGKGISKGLPQAFQAAATFPAGALKARLYINREGEDLETFDGKVGIGPPESPADQLELPETGSGEPIAIVASFVERFLMLQPRADTFSPLKQATQNANGTRPASGSVSGDPSRRFEHLDYFEKALEIGVQTYSCIPMGRFYRSLEELGEQDREKVESSLGPHLCMLLEQVRLSDNGDSPGSPEGGKGARDAAKVESSQDLCTTLTAPAAHDLSSLTGSNDQRPLNMIQLRSHEKLVDEKQPEEIMLVCISTVKMLLTIQANKNNNKVRQYIDAKDIIEVAESSEYSYFSAATSDLAHVDPSTLSQKQRTVFFINLYNLMILHAALEKARNRKEGDSKLRWLPRASPFGWMKFLRNATYNVGGNIYSALDVEHSILRSSRPYNDNVFIGRLLPYFKGDDPRLRCKVDQQIPLLTFALCPGTMCSPPFKCFHEYDFDNELVSSAQTFLARYCHTRKRSNILEVRLPLLLKWYRHDLGHGSSKSPNKWLISIAYLIKGTKVSKCILGAIDDKLKIIVKYDTYKWELGWMLQES